MALEPENGSKRCGRIKRGDLVLATGAKDGFVKLHPLMYGQPLCYSKDFSPFDISSQGWVRTYGDHQLSEDGDDELPVSTSHRTKPKKLKVFCSFLKKLTLTKMLS